MYLADTLSRAVAHVHASELESDSGRELEEVDLTLSLMVRSDNIVKICSATASDLMLLHLSEVIQSGWLAERVDTDELVRPFFSFRDELVVNDGLVYKGQRLVIPKLLRRNMLEIAHGGHVGLEATLCHLREAIFWLGMSADATALHQSCTQVILGRITLNRHFIRQTIIPQHWGLRHR